LGSCDNRTIHQLPFKAPAAPPEPAAEYKGLPLFDSAWLVSFMDYDFGYFDLETRVLEPLDGCHAI